jgi:hypothetical protein
MLAELGQSFSGKKMALASSDFTSVEFVTNIDV